MNFNGEDTFYFYLTDNKSGYNSLTGRVLIKVNAINDPPLSFNKVVNTLENEPIDITLKSADAENDEMTLAIEKPPSHGNVSDINQLTHMVTYTPDPLFAGSDNFTFSANDGKAKGESANITIAVKPTNESIPSTYRQGDVFVSTNGGKLQWRDHHGNLIKVRIHHLLPCCLQVQHSIETGYYTHCLSKWDVFAIYGERNKV